MECSISSIRQDRNNYGCQIRIDSKDVVFYLRSKFSFSSLSFTKCILAAKAQNVIKIESINVIKLRIKNLNSPHIIGQF